MVKNSKRFDRKILLLLNKISILMISYKGKTSSFITSSDKESEMPTMWPPQDTEEEGKCDGGRQGRHAGTRPEGAPANLYPTTASVVLGTCFHSGKKDLPNYFYKGTLQIKSAKV